MTLDDTKTRILSAAMKAVRQYGLEGVRIQNVSEIAGISPGAIYRHFDSKEQLLAAERFHGRRDIVNALLAEGGQYTIAEVEKMIADYMKGLVR